MKKKIFCLAFIVLLFSGFALTAEDNSLWGLFNGVIHESRNSLRRSITWEVTCYAVNMRSGPSMDDSVICVLNQGDLVNSGRQDYQDDANGRRWWHVTVIDGPCAGLSGWISESCLAEAG